MKCSVLRIDVSCLREKSLIAQQIQFNSLCYLQSVLRPILQLEYCWWPPPSYICVCLRRAYCSLFSIFHLLMRISLNDMYLPHIINGHDCPPYFWKCWKQDSMAGVSLPLFLLLTGEIYHFLVELATYLFLCKVPSFPAAWCTKFLNITLSPTAWSPTHQAWSPTSFAVVGGMIHVDLLLPSFFVCHYH